MTVTVELAGLELHGFHGLLERERELGQRFVFDVRLDVSDVAAYSDRIEDAVDYRDVAATVREVSESNRFHLLEALAAAVADSLLERFRAEHVAVRVRKPDVRLDAGAVDYSAVSVGRARS